MGLQSFHYCPLGMPKPHFCIRFKCLQCGSSLMAYANSSNALDVELKPDQFLNVFNHQHRQY